MPAISIRPAVLRLLRLLRASAPAARTLPVLDGIRHQVHAFLTETMRGLPAPVGQPAAATDVLRPLGPDPRRPAQAAQRGYARLGAVLVQLSRAPRSHRAAEQVRAAFGLLHALDAWVRLAVARPASPTSVGSRTAHVTALLAELFSEDELRRLPFDLPAGSRIEVQLPTSASALGLAHAIALQVEAHGVLPALFRRMREARPGRREDIEAVARSCGPSARHQAPRAPLRGTSLRPAERRLAELLVDMFTADELRRLAADLPGQLPQRLPGRTASAWEVARSIAGDTSARRATAQLLDAVRSARPARASEVDAVAQGLGQPARPAGGPGSTRPLQPRERALAAVLADMFSADELRRVVADMPGFQRVCDQLPGPGASLRDLARAVVVRVLEAGGLLVLFHALRVERPHRLADIDRVAQHWRGSFGAARVPSGRAARSPREQRTASLLLSLFAGNELCRLLSRLYGPELVAVLPDARGSAWDTAQHAVRLLVGLGRLDEGFFTALVIARPGRIGDIQAVSRLWTA